MTCCGLKWELYIWGSFLAYAGSSTSTCRFPNKTYAYLRIECRFRHLQPCFQKMPRFLYQAIRTHIVRVNNLPLRHSQRIFFDLKKLSDTLFTYRRLGNEHTLKTLFRRWHSNGYFAQRFNGKNAAPGGLRETSLLYLKKWEWLQMLRFYNWIFVTHGSGARNV